MSEFPEHEKMQKIQKKAQAVGEFIEWIRDKDIEFCLWDEHQSEFVPFRDSIEKILASYFGIDLTVIETEKRAMLEICRKAPA